MEVPRQATKIKLTPGNTRRRKGRRSLPMAENRMTGKKQPYAYEFTDKNLGNIQVLSTSNAWWSKPEKLSLLVAAYKFYATDAQACFHAGITEAQLEYFQKLHPDFYGIKHAAKQYPGLRARKTIIEAVDTDPSVAQWFLERTEKNLFSARVEQTGGEGRELYDGLSAEIRNLGEELRKKDDGQTTDKEHPGPAQHGDADAGPDRSADEATPATDTAKAPDVPIEAGKPV